MSELVDIVIDDDCWSFTLNRPEKMNALNAEIVEELIEQVSAAHQQGARLLVFSGHGKNFSAGFDQGQLEQETDADLLLRLVRIETLLQLVASSPCQTLAFAHGRNFGAGVDLFAVCRRRYCTEDATFRMPGLRFGLVLGTRRLGAIMGPAKAREIQEETRTITAQEALETGLVSELADIKKKSELIKDTLRIVDLLDRETQQHLYQVLSFEDANRDMADLVRSASRPGIKERMLALKHGR